jgi:hypothetical protein
MALLSRWVLAHKGSVVISWLVLTIAGIVLAGPAIDALEPGFSVPNKEGWETNKAIAARYGDTGGDTAPLVPVVTLPEGKTLDSPGVKPSWRQSTSACAGRCRDRGSPRLPRPATVPSSQTMDEPRSRLPTRGRIRARSSARPQRRRRLAAGRWKA